MHHRHRPAAQHCRGRGTRQAGTCCASAALPAVNGHELGLRRYGAATPWVPRGGSVGDEPDPQRRCHRPQPPDGADRAGGQPAAVASAPDAACARASFQRHRLGGVYQHHRQRPRPGRGLQRAAGGRSVRAGSGARYRRCHPHGIPPAGGAVTAGALPSSRCGAPRRRAVLPGELRHRHQRLLPAAAQASGGNSAVARPA